MEKAFGQLTPAARTAELLKDEKIFEFDDDDNDDDLPSLKQIIASLK
jgi:hypothetical protein